MGIAHSSLLANSISILMLLLTIISTFSFVAETCWVYQEASSCILAPTENFCEPKPDYRFAVIETICMMCFSVDYLLRLAVSHVKIKEANMNFRAVLCAHTCKRIISFFFEPFNIVDVIAIVPFWMEIFGAETVVSLGILRVLRLARVFRVFKVGRFAGINLIFVVMCRSVYRSMFALQLVIFFASMACVIFGSLMQRAEGGTWDMEEGKYNQEIDQNVWL